jgi:glycosyltransferase involved in cell wall biosynthesis
VKIAFDVTTCAKPERGGIATYGWALVAACGEVAPDHRYLLALRPNRWLRRHLLDELLPGAPRRLLVDGLSGPGLGHPQVLHAIGVRLPSAGRFAKVVTLHDINVFEQPELSESDWRDKRQARIRQTLERADLVIAYSEQGARALGEHLGFPRERVRVVPLGVDTALFRPRPPEVVDELLTRRGLRRRRFVLSAGAFGRRKNQAALLAAFARARVPADWSLVLVGPRGEQAGELRRMARSSGLADERLVLPGWVGEVELAGLMAGAGLYCCPSLHEGFGLPVIEAQACGTPVLSSDRGALPETLGEVGLTIDPTDEGAFRSALERLVEDEALREDLARRGPDRVAAGFTWPHVARLTLSVLEEAAALVAG